MPRRSSEALAVPPNYGWCGRHWSQPTSDESVASIFALIGVYVLLWSAAWFACAGVSAVLIKPRLPASTRDDENSASYIGQKLVAGLKCALVAGLTNAALLEMVGQPPHVQQLPHLYTELAGVHFTAFETADMLLSAAYGHLDRLYFVHHLIHISMGLLIRGSCGPQFTASVLMAQETSGIFLNYYLLLCAAASGAPPTRTDPEADSRARAAAPAGATARPPARTGASSCRSCSSL